MTAKYTAEELAYLQRLDDEADARFERERPLREAEEARIRAERSARSYSAPLLVSGPLDHETAYPELTYSNLEKGLWRFSVEGRSVGPLYRTRAALLADLDRYALEYGLSPRQDWKPAKKGKREHRVKGKHRP